MANLTKNNSPKQEGATILTPADLENKRYPLPASWKKAAGLLKGRGIDPLAYQRTIRAEWDKRLSRNLKLAKKKPK